MEQSTGRKTPVIPRPNARRAFVNVERPQLPMASYNCGARRCRGSCAPVVIGYFRCVEG